MANRSGRGGGVKFRPLKLSPAAELRAKGWVTQETIKNAKREAYILRSVCVPLKEWEKSE